MTTTNAPDFTTLINKGSDPDSPSTLKTEKEAITTITNIVNTFQQQKKVNKKGSLILSYTKHKTAKETDAYAHTLRAGMRLVYPYVSIIKTQYQNHTDKHLNIAVLACDSQEELNLMYKRFIDFHTEEAEDCVLCHKKILDDHYGHNPAPLKESGKCCTACNLTKVLPARFAEV